MRRAQAPDADRYCWRCQAVPAASALGVCPACLGDLRGRRWFERFERLLRRHAQRGEGPPQEPALQHAATAAALARYRRQAWKLSLTGLALVAGFAVAANIVQLRAEQLLATGATAPGVVRRLQGERMVVAFHADGQARRATVHLSSQSPDYRVGRPVTVIYDPDDPDRVRTPADTNQSPLTVIPMSLALPLGVLLTVMGSVGLVRWVRMRRVLARHAWQARPYQVQTARIGIAWVRLAVSGHPTPDDAPLLVLGFLMTPVWRLQDWLRRPYGTAWVAGDTGLMVVARPEVDAVLAARAARTAWTRSRWLRSFPEPFPPAPRTVFSPDAEPLDHAPNLCWRCNAAPATTGLGTCDACLTDLRETTG